MIKNSVHHRGLDSVIRSATASELDTLWQDLDIIPDKMVAEELRSLCQLLGEKLIVANRALKLLTEEGLSCEPKIENDIIRRSWSILSKRIANQMKSKQRTIDCNKQRKINLTDQMAEAIVNAAMDLRSERGKLPGKVSTAKRARRILTTLGVSHSDRTIVTESRVSSILEELRALEERGELAPI